MKAVRVTPPMRVGELVVSEVDLPEPGPLRVRVRLLATALNHRELLILEGTWPGWGTYTLGSDGAGIVDGVGDGVRGISIGDEVVINPGIDWGGDQRAPGDTFRTLGGPEDGCFAEAVVVPAENVCPRPDYLSWEEAAAMPLAGLTAYRGLVERAGLTSGDTLLIHGIGGGVAQAGLAIAAAIGATTIVTSSSDEKLSQAKGLGADYTVNYRTEDWASAVTRFTGGHGPDVILDSVGGDTLRRSVDMVRKGGRIVSLGVTCGLIREFPVRTLFVRHVALHGTTLGSPVDFRAMLGFYTRHQLRPLIDSVWSLDEVGQAMSRLQAGLQFGKIVMHVAAR